MTLVSRVTGLIRDIIFASFIGASASIAADAFYVAFRIPNFFRRIFGEGAFSSAFVPVFTEYKNKNSGSGARLFVDHMFGALSGILFLITLIGVIAAPVLVFLLAPGWYLRDADKYAMTVQMLRITFPYLFFISLVAMAAGVLNTYRRFGVAAFTPVLLNLCLIAAVLWLAPRMANPVMALAWGVFIAGVVQLLFQAPFLMRLKLMPRPRLSKRHEGVRKVFRLMLPAIFGVSVAQINVLVNTLLASFLITGSVSWLYYSDRLMEFPLGVFGIALATVILPSLSQRHVTASKEEFSHLLDWALRWVAVIAVPAMIGLVILAQPMLTTLFQYGAFNVNDVEMTGRALVAFSLGLVGFIGVKVLAPGFYARQDVKTPVRVGVIAFGSNIIMSLLLVYPLAHVGLALAISIAAYINSGLLFFLLRRLKIYNPLPGWRWLAVRITLASTAMAIVLWWGAGEPGSWIDADISQRVLRLGGWIVVGFITYFLVMLLLGTKPAELMLKKVKVQGDA